MSAADWKELCEAIMKEMDPEKLMDLVDQLNRTLEEREKELRRKQEGGTPVFNQSASVPGLFETNRTLAASIYNQPLVRAMRAASTRLFAPNLLMASER